MEQYRGGRFETGGTGGASGMIFFIDRGGRQMFCGGLDGGDAQTVVDALNATLALVSGR